MNEIILLSETKESLVKEISESVLSGMEYILNSHSRPSAVDQIHVSIPEAAECLRVSKVTIYDYIKKGILTKKKIGGRTLISKDELLKAIQSVDSKANGHG